MTDKCNLPAGNEPACFTAGDSVEWRSCFPDYLPSDGWTLNYAIRGPSVHDVVATPDGDEYVSAINATDSATLSPGVYYFQGYVTKAGERHTVSGGEIKVAADLAGAGPDYDGRSQALQILDAIDALILGKATKDQLSYSINGRSLTRYSMEELIALRDKYAAIVAAEKRATKAAKGFGIFQHIKVRFRE